MERGGLAAVTPTAAAALPSSAAQSNDVDFLLCSLHRVAAGLGGGVEASGRDSSPTGPHIVDLSLFEARARRIATLRHLHAELGALVETVARLGAAAEALHHEEAQAMQECLDAAETLSGSPRSGPPATPEHGETVCGTPSPTVDVRGIPWKDHALTARIFGRDPCPGSGGGLAAPCPPPPGTRAIPATPRVGVSCALARGTVALSPRVALDAVVVPKELTAPREILDAVSTPELYFIPQWNHFAVRVGAVVFHGNLGRVYPSGGRGGERYPERVKECRHRKECARRAAGGCAYYHNPADVPGSRDVRNFMADSWVYLPASSCAGARYGSRRIGSRESLEADLCEVTASEARRHMDQTTHDILCAVILAKYVL